MRYKIEYQFRLKNDFTIISKHIEYKPKKTESDLVMFWDSKDCNVIIACIRKENLRNKFKFVKIRKQVIEKSNVTIIVKFFDEI